MDFTGLKYLIVGSGFYGSTLAERIATVLGERVLVLEKRKHVGGNSFSSPDPETGIEIHHYGSHIFHTSNEEVWNYVRRFSAFNDYRHYVLTRHNSKIYSMPINLKTINAFYGKNFSSEEAKAFLEAEIQRDFIAKPRNLEEKAISLIGRPLYEAFIKGYTQKQWETPLTELPENIITRLPVRFDENERYFSDLYEGQPLGGYGELFKRMLLHPLIEVALGVDFFEIKEKIPSDCKIVFTGPIDRYFDFKHGTLGWRTCDFKLTRYEMADFQGCAVVNEADISVPYTRIHEFKHYHPERDYPAKTLSFTEFSRRALAQDDPYYPINTEADKKKLALYKEEASKLPNVIFGGRLGSYSYLDMHQAIAMGLNDFKSKLVKII